MRTIVFGGSGFIGSHVADALTDRGHKVIIFDLKPSPYIRPEQEMIVGDILDYKTVREAVKGCDYVYNFAGIADLDDATTKPIETVVQNIKGTVTLLEASRQANIKRFIYASTIYVYSNKGGFYRCSKQAAESYLEEFQRKYGLPFTILHYGALYGTRTDLRNAVYRYIYQAINEKHICCQVTGEEIREYINVKDAAKLSVEILDAKYKNQCVVITGHNPLKSKELLATIKEMLDNETTISFEPSENFDHYKITPYSFTPKIGCKLTTDYYIDMGQGLLEVMGEIFDTLKKDKISLNA